MPKISGDNSCDKVPLPLAYALLSSKKEEQYSAVFEAIVSAANEYGIENLKPRHLMSDFELAVINAAFTAFDAVDIDLCYFHLKQSEYRHVTELGPKVAYSNPEDSSLRKFCNMLAALAYVPVGDVKVAFNALAARAPQIP